MTAAARETGFGSAESAGEGSSLGSKATTLLLALLVVSLCLTPFLLVIAISFGEKIEGAAWRWAFTFDNYKRFFVGADWPNSTSFLYLSHLWYSLYYSLVAAVLAVVTAFPFTYLMTRQSRRRQTLWLILFLSSMSLSEVFVVMGWDVLLSNRSGLPMVFRESGVTEWLKEVGWFQTFRDWGLANPRDLRFKPTDFATILTLTYLVWPYAVILLYPALARIDAAMLEAARTMRAGPLTVVRTVVLPLTRTPIIGAVLLLFVFLLGAYVTIAVFAPPAKHTLAISVYEAVRGMTLNAPFGSAQAVILLLTAATLLVMSTRLTRKAGRSRR